MKLAHYLVIVSGILSFFAASFYIRDTLKGVTQPNKISWFLWGLLPLIGTGAAVHAGADLWATVRIFLAGFFPLIIFLTSFLNKNSYWRISSFDKVCALCAFISIAIWLLWDSPRTVILFAVIGDTFAALPTFVKAWKYPGTETGVTYLISFIGALLVVPVIPKWNIENSAFQIYLITVNFILIFAIYRQKALRWIYDPKE